MKKSFALLVVLVLIAAGYLLFWPVPINPVAWQAPENAGYKDAFEPNTRLQALKFIDLGSDNGPEDAAVGPAGALYAPTHSGKILKISLSTGQVTDFATPGGRVLGIEFAPDGTLFAADAYRGLLQIDGAGQVTVLADKTENGSPIRYANDLDVATDGTIYFSDASTKFGSEANGGTLPASILDLMEHGPHGRILKYDPATGRTSVLLDGLHFANGVALAADESYLLIAETGTYSILKHWLTGTRAGTTETLLNNLPGFPDNINDNPNGTFWFGLVSPRSAPVDGISNNPFLRKIVMRLPAALRPKPQRYGFAVRIDGDGNVLENLQDPSGNYALVTGGLDMPDGEIVITSLTEPRLGYLVAP